MFCNDLQIHTVELSKFAKRAEEAQKEIEKWAYFLKHGENLEEETLPESLQVEPIKKAVKELEVFTKDEIEREMYEAREKAILDYTSAMHEQERIGMKKGIQGMKKGIEGMLEIKFGADALHWMKEIQNISDLDKLTEIQNAVKKAKNEEEFGTYLK